MTDTRPKVLRDLLAGVAKLEGNLQDALGVAGDHAAEVDPILKKVQNLFPLIETIDVGNDDSVEMRTTEQLH